MKAFGYVRKLDDLGRIVLPASLRRSFDLDDRSPVEIFVDGECLVLKKYVPTCSFCESVKDIKEFQGKKICIDCITAMYANIKVV